MKKEAILPTEVIFNLCNNHFLVEPLITEERLERLAAKLYKIAINFKGEDCLVRLRKHEHASTVCFLKLIDGGKKTWLFSIDAHQLRREGSDVVEQDIHPRFPNAEAIAEPYYPIELVSKLIKFCNAHLPEEAHVPHPLYKVGEDVKKTA